MTKTATHRSFQVFIRDDTGKIVADIDARSTMDAMAYFLTTRAPYAADWATRRDMAAEGLRLRAAADSSWITPDSEAPGARFKTEVRCPLTGVRLWAYAAEVHGAGWSEQCAGWTA